MVHCRIILQQCFCIREGFKKIRFFWDILEQHLCIVTPSLSTDSSEISIKKSWWEGGGSELKGLFLCPPIESIGCFTASLY